MSQLIWIGNNSCGILIARFLSIWNLLFATSDLLYNHSLSIRLYCWWEFFYACHWSFCMTTNMICRTIRSFKQLQYMNTGFVKKYDEIANELLEQAQYDPLHYSSGFQSLYWIKYAKEHSSGWMTPCSHICTG